MIGALRHCPVAPSWPWRTAAQFRRSLVILATPGDGDSARVHVRRALFVTKTSRYEVERRRFGDDDLEREVRRSRANACTMRATYTSSSSFSFSFTSASF